jgi:hypothetical protein
MRKTGCRLIYHEARLLPFELNDFTFWADDTLLNFCKRLTSAQLGALTSVHIKGVFDIGAELPGVFRNLQDGRNLRRVAVDGTCVTGDETWSSGKEKSLDEVVKKEVERGTLERGVVMEIVPRSN